MTHPARIIAWRRKRSALTLANGPAFEAEEARPGDKASCAEEAEYVLASVADSEPRRLAEALAASERYADTYRDAWEKASNERHALRTETEALRRERDALRLVARRAGDVLAWVAMWVPDGAYDDLGAKLVPALNEAIDKAAQAAKGVG